VVVGQGVLVEDVVVFMVMELEDMELEDMVAFMIMELDDGGVVVTFPQLPMHVLLTVLRLVTTHLVWFTTGWV